MGSKSGGQRVYDFFLSIDYGVCLGPVDSINAITIKDDDALVGPLMGTGLSRIDQPELFGGDEAEGGPVGIVEVYMGDYGQKMSESLAARHGLTPDTAPGYQGITHLFFRGDDEDAAESEYTELSSSGPFLGVFPSVLALMYDFLVSRTSTPEDHRGFKWTSNNPYLPGAAVNATRAPVGLPAALSLVYPIVGVNGAGEYEIAVPGDAFSLEDGVRVLDRSRLPDANPAAMVYEMMTNAEVGKGDSPAAFNLASYEAAAATLLEENFGLTMTYMLTDSVETYVSEILDHILGVQFQDPATGLWTLTLIRGDYNEDDLLVIDPSNCDSSEIHVKLWGDTINEVAVSYTDPNSGEEETVYAQNATNIAIQGGKVSDPRDYYGIRNPWLAKIVAERDVASASRTLTSATLKANRDAFNVRPGSVLLWSWPEEDVLKMPVRVMSVDYGTAKDRTITLEVIEDVFGTPGIVLPAEIQPIVNYDIDPLPKNPDRVLIFTPPLPPMVRGGLDVSVLDANYPQSEVQFLVSDSEVSFLETKVESATTLANGTTSIGTVATVLPAYSRALGVALVREARSEITSRTVENLMAGEQAVGDLLLIGESEQDHELVMLDSYNSTTRKWSILRGLYDTVPLVWAADARLWLLPLSESTLDNRENFAGDTQTYRLRPRTRRGRLSFAAATPRDYTPNERLHQPFRPANPTVDGLAFVGPVYVGAAVPSSVLVNWKTRNRLSEDAVASEWGSASVTPEPGQTTTIRLRDSITGVVDLEVSGLAGSSANVDITSATTFRYYDLEVLAARDGIESYRESTVSLELVRLGYGNNYGNDYGENNG